MSKHTVLFCFFFEKAGLSFLQKQHQYDINFSTIISSFVSRNFTEFNASEPFEYPDICFFSSKQKDGCFHIKVNPLCAHEYWKMTLKKKVKEQIQNKTQKIQIRKVKKTWDDLPILQAFTLNPAKQKQQTMTCKKTKGKDKTKQITTTSWKVCKKKKIIELPPPCSWFLELLYYHNE